MLAYWLEIAMFSYDLATTWWPIPTIILAVLVILVKASQDNWKSLNEWASSVGIALAIFLVGLVFLYAPYAHNAKLRETIAQDDARKLQQPVIKDDRSPSIISDLQQQLNRKDIEAQELKRLRDRADDVLSRTGLENSSLKTTIRDLQSKLDELQGKLTEKANRKAIRQQLGSYVEEGEELKRRCLNKEDAKLLATDADQWVRRAASYMVAKLDSSYAIQFVNPPAPQPIAHNVPPENDSLWRILDVHVGVLRKFMGEFS